MQKIKAKITFVVMPIVICLICLNLSVIAVTIIYQNDFNIALFILIILGLIFVAFYFYILINRENINGKYKENLSILEGNSHSIFCIFNARKTKIEYVSENIEEIFGIDRKSIMRDYSNLLKYFDSSLAEEMIELFEISLAKNVIKREIYFTNPKTKIQKWMKLKVIPVKESSVSKYIITINDIDELKKREILLKDSMITAQKAYEAKSEFMSRMSHDIKNPLNAIIGIATIALRKSNIQEEMSDSLNKILNSSAILLKILNNILDMSKIENGKETLLYEPFTMQEIVNDIITVIKPQAKEKNICLSITNKFEHSKTLMGDALKVKQILFNLLSNAIKFSRNNGIVKLHVYEGATINHKYVSLRFIINDTGIGISDEFIEKIYTPFEQENRDPSIKNDGSGLGMSIVKSLVYLMNGTIKVTSKVNVGSTFVVEIPFDLKEYTKYHVYKDDCQDVDCRTKRFLVVDDDELNLEITSEILKMTGAHVECASNGQDAIKMFRESPSGYYNVIFMDLRMPVLDGFETTKSIRALEHIDAKTIFIIALSANSFTEDVSKALEYGMNMHISKPINISRINKALIEIFQK